MGEGVYAEIELFVYLYSYLLCWRLTIGVWVYFWIPYSILLVCMSVLDYYGFVILSEVWESYTSCLVSPQPMKALAIFGLLLFHKKI